MQHLSVVAGSREVAADAVQEAFVVAHVKWDRISTYEDPAGWVRRVALNRIRNHHRWRGRSRAAAARLGGGTTTMGSVVERVDLAEALATLSLRQRAAVALHHLEGLSVEEVAAEFKVTRARSRRTCIGAGPPSETCWRTKMARDPVRELLQSSLAPVTDRQAHVLACWRGQHSAASRIGDARWRWR